MPHYIAEVRERTSSIRGPLEAPSPEEAARQARETVGQTVKVWPIKTDDETGEPQEHYFSYKDLEDA